MSDDGGQASPTPAADAESINTAATPARSGFFNLQFSFPLSPTLSNIRLPQFQKLVRRLRHRASAPPAESLPAQKNFFAKTSFTRKAPPLSGRTIFGQVFVRGGMTNSKWNVPLPGGQAR